MIRVISELLITVVCAATMIVGSYQLGRVAGLREAVKDVRSHAIASEEAAAHAIRDLDECLKIRSSLQDQISADAGQGDAR